MRLAVLSWLVVAVACGTPAASPKSFQPSQVVELATLPPGYNEGELLRVSCSGLASAAFDDESLDNVDCNAARLSRVLRARAGELSARFIVGVRCQARSSGRSLTCSARVARAGSEVALTAGETPSAAPAPSAEEVLDLDEPRPQDANAIRVGFAPAPSGKAALSRRSYDNVAETRLPAVGRGVLGQVSARCDGCDASALRHALRVTAGRVGAGEVTAVKCFQDEGGARCVAIALVPWSS